MIFIADMHENYPAMVSGQEHIRKFPNKYMISVKRWYALEKKWLRQADHIVCTAPGMIDRLTRVLGKARSFALVPNTIQPEAFLATQKPFPETEKKYEGKFVVLYYGGVSQQRGIQHLIEAVPLLAKDIPGLKIVIVGDGSYLQNLKKQAKETGTENHVDFEGWQPQSKLGSYLKNTDIAIIPHLKSEHTDNTSPNKIFMFMLYAKPVLVSNCKYLEDIIEDTQSGLIFESGNPADLARQILKLYRDGGLRTKLGENAKKSLYEKYQWNSTVEPLKKIYQLYLE
jgi:glycosyltransferase involved in cell wall biosynthesis